MEYSYLGSQHSDNANNAIFRKHADDVVMRIVNLSINDFFANQAFARRLDHCLARTLMPRSQQRALSARD